MKQNKKRMTQLLPPQGANADLILKVEQLLPGDVLLYRPRKPKPHQHIIMSATGSDYTHAVIYLGDQIVAESGFPFGVRKKTLQSAIHGSLCVAVLRTQMEFGAQRAQQLREFVDSVCQRHRFYDWKTALWYFEDKSSQYFDNHLEFINENYGLAETVEDFSRKAFICSAFIVACYSVVGIIATNAQVAYKPKYFSPAHLHSDPTFGWLLGYLVPQSSDLPATEPLPTQAMWRDNMNMKWW